MTAPAVTNTFVANTNAVASQVNTNFSDLVTYISNRNDGTATWDRTLVTSATAVPLIVNNSTGTSNIANFQDNGSNVFQILHGGDCYRTAYTDYFSSSSIVGWTSPSGVIYYKQIGKLTWVWFSITGTSNSATTTFTLPAAFAAGFNLFVLTFAIDNGGTAVPGLMTLNQTTSLVTLFKDIAASAFTNTGTKTVGGSFFYQTT